MGYEGLLEQRIAFINKIVTECDNIGKTKIQKISYFLQESVGIDLKYPFRMHYYGPYSDDLDQVVSLAETLGHIDISPDPNGFGYHVTATTNGEDEPKQIGNEKVDAAIRVLGILETVQLELYATIHFVTKQQPENSKNDTINVVGKIKPKFHPDHIESAYDLLKNSKLIAVE